MMKCPVAAILSSALMACATAPAKEQNAGIRWWDFVGDVRDCSTETLHCLSGEVLNLSVPKACTDVAKGHWGETRVLDQGDSAEYQMHSRLMRVQPLYVLGDESHPHTVYLYTGTGVMGLYTDPDRATDLVTIAKTGGLAGVVNAGGVRDRYYQPFIANVLWGRCR